MFIIGFVSGALIGLILLFVFTPRLVEYVETVSIKGNSTQIYDAIRFQESLMQWSSWPSETQSTCYVEAKDGELGATTVFVDKKGNRFGHQEMVKIEPDVHVSFRLESKGPPHRPNLDFYITEGSKGMCTVVMSFRNHISAPFHVFLRVFGIIRWTRAMHLKDLDGLKRFVEDSVTYEGQPIQRKA
ncbi:MAG: hypothetical protein AAF065_01100 [Verrucomicrobiota bacterium]